jgi:hypothetical protein
MHFRGIPPAINALPAPLCDLRSVGETTTILGDIDCPTCRRILKLDGKQWAPRQDPKMNPASRSLIDRKRAASGDET